MRGQEFCLRHLPFGAAGEAEVLTPRADGAIVSKTPVLLPVMAPRLQADVFPDGAVDLSLWGVGKLGRVRFTPLTGPCAYGPNRGIGRKGGVYVAHLAPVMLIQGGGSARVFPARRCAWWHEISAKDAKPTWSKTPAGRVMELPWGVVQIEQRGYDLLLSVGVERDEAARGMALSAEQIIAEADAYARRCDLLPDADLVLRTMVIQGVHAALSSIRQDETGAFAGLAAGQAYSSPARTYYRDGYWTLQPLLTLAPDAVREQIRMLAKGVQPDGAAPSGVILSSRAHSKAWRAFREHPDRYKEHHLRPEDWWSDHFDSPLFFILAVGDYVRETGDAVEAQLHWGVITSIVERYFRYAGPDGLPLKPRHDRDWADNVYREGLVAYDLGLWVGAMDVVATLGAKSDPALAKRAKDAAAHGRKIIDRVLWTDTHQGYADYATPGGFVEDHLVLDSLPLPRYDAVPEDKALRLLRALERTLESRHNSEQPYGDWGMLCAYPPFKRVADIRAKTAFPFRYHNGSDWPYLDGLYAE